MAKKTSPPISYQMFTCDVEACARALGHESLIKLFSQMVEIRQFELRAEAAYQKGHVGGFFHSYIGQEAIQVAAVEAIGGAKNWWVTTYRCHALALLLGNTHRSLMAELYGKETGNALGRGGSMHFYGERLLGGFGIVGGHVPVAVGAAFSLKYQGQEGVAVCFLGDGAVAQGAIHESLNLAALWDLPCIFVIENNQWGMGTAVNRAIAALPIAENLAKAYQLPSYTFDGMDVLSCYAGFQKVYKQVQDTGKPVVIEVLVERFRGHSISDAALYRTSEELLEAKRRDPILLFSHFLKERGVITDETIQSIEKEIKKSILDAVQFAEESLVAGEATLEEDVFAP